MTDVPALSKSVSDWEIFFLNRNNTHEISAPGGNSYLGMLAETFHLPGVISDNERQIVYTNMVQAILNRWTELASVDRDPYEDEPITVVARMAFGKNGVIEENLRPNYERLWRESPRPHSSYHLSIALNSNGALPITRVDAVLLFQLDGWGLVVARLASQKGWNNTAINFCDKLQMSGAEVSEFGIDSVVRAGFPKLKGLRWMRLLHKDTKSGQHFIKRYEEELLTEGVSEEEISA